MELCEFCNRKKIGHTKKLSLCRLSIKPLLLCENEYIDKFIQNTKSKNQYCDDFIEWIPCSDIKKNDKIKRGGFSEVFSGKWIPFKQDEIGCNNEIVELPNVDIVLKVLKGSENFEPKFLDEFKIHYKCLEKGAVPFYGLTKSETQYAMVMKRAIHGDLRTFIENNVHKLTWIERLKVLLNIAKSLNGLHESDIIHRDFHCANILVDDDTEIYISDFGLSVDPEFSSSADSQSKEIEGVLPYVAPEVLLGKPYTTKSDIYSLGIIMWELTSSDRPFPDLVHDLKLALDIVNRHKRPEVIDGTPEVYETVMKKCWDADPSNRPNSSELIEEYEKMINNPNLLSSYKTRLIKKESKKAFFTQNYAFGKVIAII